MLMILHTWGNADNRLTEIRATEYATLSQEQLEELGVERLYVNLKQVGALNHSTTLDDGERIDYAMLYLGDRRFHIVEEWDVVLAAFEKANSDRVTPYNVRRG